MKTVRVLVGSAGIAAPFFAFLMPAPHIPATRAPDPAPAPQASSAKKVSLRLTAALLGSTGLTTSNGGVATGGTSSAAVSPAGTTSPTGGLVTAQGGCTGNIKVHTKWSPSSPAGVTFKPSTSANFWYRKAIHDSGVCIGTVEGQWNDGPSSWQNSYRFRVRIYSGTGTKKRLVHQVETATKGKNYHTLTGGSGVHEWFGFSRGLPVQVCTTWLWYQGSVVAGGACVTVR